MASRSAQPTLAGQALLALAVHRMLTVQQLRELLTPDATATSNWSARLNKLARAGHVRALPRMARGAKVWCCTRAGLREAMLDPDQWRRPYEVPETGGTLAAHTLAVNETGIAFTRAARVLGDECDWHSWEHEVAHSMGSGRGRRTLIADAVLTYEQLAEEGGGRLLRRFIEVDRATEPVPKLVDKLRMYAAYRAWIPSQPEGFGLAPGQPAWRARYQHWPATCVVIGANPGKDRAAVDRRIDQLIDLCRDDSLMMRGAAAPLPVLICNFDDVVTAGPWAPIWWRLDHPETPVDVTGRVPEDVTVG